MIADGDMTGKEMPKHALGVVDIERRNEDEYEDHDPHSKEFSRSFKPKKSKTSNTI